MVSATILALLELVGIFVFGTSISWLLFRILRTKLKHTPTPDHHKEEPDQAKDLRVAVEQARLDVARTKLRTEEIRLLALQTRAEVIGRRKDNDHTSDTS